MKTLLSLMGLAIFACPHAAFVIDTDPSVYPGTENILFMDPMLIQTGPLVQGKTNVSDMKVNYFGAGEDLDTSQHQVNAIDGSFNNLTIEPDVSILGFGAYQFNLNVLDAGNLTIDLLQGGSVEYSETFEVTKQGPNFFRIYSTEGEVISSIQLTTDVGIDAVRLNRALILPEAVPEPLTIVPLAVALAGLGLARKRR